MTPSVSLSRIVLMVRRSSDGLGKAVDFYHRAVGLPLLRATDDWAEFDIGGGNGGGSDTASGSGVASTSTTTTLTLQAVDTESQLTTGYSPILTFALRGDSGSNNDDDDGSASRKGMDETVAACVQAGAHLDGPIQYHAHGKIAALRSPDGHMIGLYEPVVV